ncbi:MAG: hypothetical protein IJQ85_01580 [Selenomonadaceae bacterium]|nr:hypothetical protein [Selenomonadaceae bacterium]
MVFIVKITADDGTVIELGKAEQEENNQGNCLTDVNIHLDTIDNDAKQKSSAMLAKIEVFGKIYEESNSKTMYKSLFDWAKSLEKNQWYRTVDIEIKDDGGEETFRKYHFEKVFVVDYKEFYGKNNDMKDNHFKLFMTQKENTFKTIETY